jgi:hypothetical protein
VIDEHRDMNEVHNAIKPIICCFKKEKIEFISLCDIHGNSEPDLVPTGLVAEFG